MYTSCKSNLRRKIVGMQRQFDVYKLQKQLEKKNYVNVRAIRCIQVAKAILIIHIEIRR